MGPFLECSWLVPNPFGREKPLGFYVSTFCALTMARIILEPFWCCLAALDGPGGSEMDSLNHHDDEDGDES